MLACGALALGPASALAVGNLSINPMGSPITNTNAPIVGGTDEPAGSGYGDITLTVFNGNPPTSTVAGYPITVTQDNAGAGFWQTTLSALLNGTYTLEVDQTDGVNPDTATQVFSIEVPPGTPSFTSTPSNPTGSTSASFSWTNTTSNDSNPNDTTYQCSLDGAPFSSCSSPHAFTAAEGSHTFQVVAVDAENNSSSPVSFSWSVDTTPPNEVINTPTQGQAFTLDQNVPASFACPDPISAGVSSGTASCQGNVYYNGSASPTATINNGDPLPTGQEGPYKLTVTGTDNVGNSSTSQPVYYHVDPANYKTFTQGLNPTAFYRLSDSRGSTTLTDSSGNGHNGTYQNNVRLGRPSALNCENPPSPLGGLSNGFTNFCTTADDWYGGGTTGTSAFFNGQSNSGAHAYVNGISLPYQHYTLEAWVNPTGSSDMAILQHGSGGALYIQGGSFKFNPSSNNASPVVTSGLPVGAYTGNPHNHGWHLVAGTWDGTTARLYIDGGLAGSATGVTGLSTSSSTFYVGLANINGIPTFHGLMQNVGYFGSALGADAIADQWEIGTYDSYDYSTGYPTGTKDMTAPLISSFEPYDGAALSTDSNKKPFQITFSTTDEDDPLATTCSLTLNGSPVALNSTPNGPFGFNWSAAIPDTVGSYTAVVSCQDGNGNTTSKTFHYTYGHFTDVIHNDTPTAYYRLDEPSTSSTLTDSSGHGFNGQFKNDQNSFAAGVSGDSNSSRQFLGAGGYAYANNIAAPTEGYTLEGWVTLQDTGNQSIVEHGGAGSVFVRGGQFIFRPNANVAVEVSGGSGAGCVPVASGNPLPAAPTFQEFDAVWDGVTASLYIDGQLCGQSEVALPPFPSGSATFYLGFGSQEPWLRGALDEVSYYSTAFSSDQVSYHHLADPPLSTGRTTSSGGSGSGSSGGGSTGGGSTGGGSTPAAGGAVPIVILGLGTQPGTTVVKPKPTTTTAKPKPKPRKHKKPKKHKKKHKKPKKHKPGRHH